MATYTTNLNLEKPATSENFNLSKINSNWDKIDAGYGNISTKANRTATGWGSTLTWTANGALTVLMISNLYLVIVWNSSTSDVNVMVLNPNGIYSKNGSNNIVKFGGVSTDENYKIERSGSQLTLTCPGSQTIKILT